LNINKIKKTNNKKHQDLYKQVSIKDGGLRLKMTVAALN